MAALKNKKHEAVVQLKVAGKTPTESYACVLNEGNVKRHTFERLDSFDERPQRVDGAVLRKIVDMTAGGQWDDAAVRFAVHLVGQELQGSGLAGEQGDAIL